MTPLSLVATGFLSLRHHKLRSSLTMLGIVFGVGAVIAMLAIGEGARRQSLLAIQGMGLHNVLVDSRRPSVADQDRSKNAQGQVLSYGISAADRRHLAACVPGVRWTAATRQIKEALKVSAGARTVEATVIATERRYLASSSLRIDRGRFICDLDGERRLPVAVLGHQVARDLFRYLDPLGRDVRIAGTTYRVVGVLTRATGEATGAGLSSDRLDRAIYIPQVVADARVGTISYDGQTVTRVEIGRLVLRFADDADVVRSAELVRRALARAHRWPDFEIVVPLELLRQKFRTQRIFTVVMSSIAGISLLVGGIGIMNIMLATVLERTREIGIRRAVGASRANILGQFLVETVVLAVIGGLVGTMLGVAGAVVVSGLSGWPTTVPIWSMFLAVGISGTVGVVFGLYPAALAARMQPVAALRH